MACIGRTAFVAIEGDLDVVKWCLYFRRDSDHYTVGSSPVEANVSVSLGKILCLNHCLVDPSVSGSYYENITI